MSIATEIQRLQSAKASIKTSIEQKGVTVPDTATLGAYPALIDQIERGGGGTAEAEDNDVIFIDYDGTRLYSYTAEEFLAISEMPANPSHDDLIARGWNWTLSDAQEYVRKYGYHVIGQQYWPSGYEVAKFYMDFSEVETPSLTIYYTSTGAHEVDWGDGEKSSSSYTGNRTLSHTYAGPGKYVIRFMSTVLTGFTFRASAAGLDYNVFGSTRVATGGASIASSCLTRLELGYKCSGIGNYAFNGCGNLKTLILPAAVSLTPTIGLAAFSYCQSLKCAVIPTKMNATLGEAAFRQDSALKYVSIPNDITAISTRAFFDARTLEKLIIPSGVTTIGDNSLNYSGVRVLVLGGTTAGNLSLQYTTALKTLVIGDEITTLPALFPAGSSYAASGVNKITIPANVTSIAAAGLYGYALSIVIMQPTVPPTIQSNTFGDSVQSIYVPAESVDAYKAATNWTSKASIIKPIPE